VPFDLLGSFAGVQKAQLTLPPDAEKQGTALWTTSLRLIKSVIGTDAIALLQSISTLSSAT